MDTERNFTHSFAAQSKEDLEMEMIRKGPWTSEEDQKLTNFISEHGEGRWDSLARFAGLKRTGKSCRFRWLNYLRPNVIRGNITTQEQILIFELHSLYGSRWSRIAQHLPGRTDNEIKNYWRTKVQKLAKQLKCDVNSYEFKYIVHYVWLPKLMEQVQASSDQSLTAYSSNYQRDSFFSTLSHPSNVYQNVMTERDVVLQTGINIVPIDTNRRSNVSHATIETHFDSDISPSSVPYDCNHDDDTINNWCNNIFEDHELISSANQLRDTHSTPFYLDDNMAGLIWGNYEDFGFLHPTLAHESNSSDQAGYIC